MDRHADVDTIKKAFRREIARYHPDKVLHLGPEFHEMAVTRAAELTAAYTTLTNPEKRAEYDALLGGPVPLPAPPPPSHTAHAPQEPASATPPRSDPAPPPPTPPRFSEERAGLKDIVRRAVLARVREVLNQVLGECETPTVTGFDLACLPKPRTSLLKRTQPPSVLVKMAAVVDATVATEACRHALRVRGAPKPVILLLIGSQLASSTELGRAIEEQRRKHPAMADAVFPVPVDVRDWSARIPVNAPPTVRTLLERLKSAVI